MAAVGLPLRLQRLLAYCRNETMQILRDPVRLAFAFVGSALLMLVFGFGITTDVEHIRYAALDRDQSPESRAYLEQFAGSKLLLHARPAPVYSDEEAPPAPAVRRHLAGRRDPAELRPRLAPRQRARGAGAGRWRHALPRRDRRAVRAGGAQHGARGSRQRPRAPVRASTPPRSRTATCTTRPSRASTRSCRACRRCC